LTRPNPAGCCGHPAASQPFSSGYPNPISLFHASALANAAAAAQHGDQADAEAWQQVADGIWEAIMEGNAAALDYLQREAGQTRAGCTAPGLVETRFSLLADLVVL
jgi:hypothetical protein